MVESEDHWPSYNIGRPKHLHALGVISVCYNALERGMDELYQFHPDKQKWPKELVHAYYFSLSEEKRLLAIIEIFKKYEHDKKVLAAVKNLIQYFGWCRLARNTLLHAEHYPPMLGGDPELLYLTKRVNKHVPKTGYVTVGLKFLRNVADRIQEGIVQGARVRVFLRVRGVPANELPVSLRMFANQLLPEKLPIPRPLKVRLKPHNPELP